MSILYIIFIIFIVYTIMYGIVSLFSAVIPSIMVFNNLIKNKKRYLDVEKEGKKITLILNEEKNINEFILKINSLTKLDYENYDIFIVVSSNNTFLSKRIISTFKLQKENKSFIYNINKEEIISIYSNGKINLLIKEQSRKWNNINAVIDNIDSDLFMVLEENIDIERTSLSKLAREFMLFDDNLFSMGIIKSRIYIDEENLNFKGIKTHNFLLGSVILKSIKNKLFLKTFNEEFCSGFESGNNFTLYNRKKVKDVGGFVDNCINPNNDLKNRLTKEFGDRYSIDYEALAFKQEEDFKPYLFNEMYSTYINAKNQKAINSFMGLSKFYEFLSSVLNPILELPIIIFSLVLAFLNVISIKEFLLFLLLYISFDILKNILLIITDKISIGKNYNFVETLELIGFCIVYDFGLRQYYDLHKLSVRFHKDEKIEEYYKENEIFGHIDDKSPIVNEKLQNKVDSIVVLSDKGEEKILKKVTPLKQETIEENEIDIPMYDENEYSKEDMMHTGDLENIIDEINSFQVDDNIISTEKNKDGFSKIDEEDDELLDSEEISYIEDTKNIKSNIQNIEKEQKNEKVKKEKTEGSNKNSDLQKIIKQVEQTYSKIEALEKAVNKELSDIEKRSGHKDINKEIDELKLEIDNQEKNIKNYNEQSAKKEIASTSLDEMSEEEIKKEFEKITI